MKRFFPKLCVVLLTVGLASASGCTVTESENVKTSGMWAHFVIDHHPDDLVVAWAALRVGGQLGTIIDLTGGDSMECNGTHMTEYVEVLTNMHWSRAEISPDTDGIYDFTFIRPDEEVITTVVTPSLPVIIETDPPVTVGAGDMITVTWDATDAGDHMNFFVSGTCIKNIGELDKEDDGEYQLSALEDFDPQDPTECTVTLELRRWVEGDVASDFQDGYTEAKRMDAVTFNYE